MEQEIKSSAIRAFNNYHLSFSSKSFNAKYGCSVLFSDTNSKNEIRYKLNISFTGNLENKLRTFIIDREDKIYVNDVIQNNFIDKLALETSKILYPLHIKTKKNGEFIEILNFEDIINRWQQKKKKLEEDYKDKLTKKYINATDKSLISKEILLKKISKDWFINLYFNKIYKFYSQDLYINEKLSYPVLNNIKPVDYKVVSKIKLNEDTKDIRVDINGTIDDERCAMDFEQNLDYPYFKELNENEKPLEGSCDIIYLLNGKTAVIEAIEAEFITKLSTPKRIMVKMFLLKNPDEKSTFIIEDEKDKEEETGGFWSKIFKKRN